MPFNTIDADDLDEQTENWLHDHVDYAVDVLGMNMNDYQRSYARSLARQTRPDGQFDAETFHTAPSAEMIRECQRNLTESLLDQKEQTIIEAIANTDFGATPVLDIWFSAPNRDTANKLRREEGIEPIAVGMNYRVERHESPAPPLDVVAEAHGTGDLYRLTRPLLERLDDQYDGFDIPLDSDP